MSSNQASILLRQAQQGDKEAYEKLFKHYWSIVFSFILKKVGRIDLAEELTQECFLRVHRSLVSVNTESNCESWLFRIAYNLCLDRLRYPKHSVCYVLWEGAKHDHLLITASSEDQALSNDTRRLVVQALEGIPIKSRKVLILFTYGYKYKEIAVMLNLSMSAVRMRLFRAREEFRRVYLELVKEDAA